MALFQWFQKFLETSKKSDHRVLDHKSFVSSKKKKAYHLVLSGGGLRGLAHIGVYKALVEEGYNIVSVGGTSIGSLVGVFIAAQKTPEEIERIFTERSLYKVFGFSFSGDGVFSAKKIKKILSQELSCSSLEDLPLPLTVCITDYTHAEALYCESGDIQELIIASCTIPGVFESIAYDERILLDGGMFDNMPVSTSKGLPIIASHVNPRIFDAENPKKDIAVRALEMLIGRDIASQAKQCDIFFEPPELTELGFGFGEDSKKIIDIGYQYAKSLLEKNK